MSDAPTPDAEGHDWLHTFIRVAWILAGIIVATLVLSALFLQVSASPAVCASCHEITERVETWEAAAHSQVACSGCHEDHRPWYRFPETVAFRAGVLVRDVSGHFASGEATNTLTDTGPPAIPDARCLRCHTDVREVSTRDGILLDHKKHSDNSESCVSCHLFTSHRPNDPDGPLLLMELCFECHGQPETPDASGACEVCHGEQFELRPASHQSDQWQAEHGTSAKAEQPRCLMCHEETLCTSCHGIEMPHPAEWAEGATEHGPAVREDREICARCHEDSPGFCTVCHHEGYDPAQGAWFPQHPNNAKQQGTESCAECHEKTFCAYCHTTTSIGGESAPGIP